MSNSSKKSTTAGKKPAKTTKAATPETAEKKTSPAKATAKRPAAIKAAAPAKTATKTAAPKAPAKKAAASKALAKPKAAKKTTIVVDADVGFGNHLFLRGEGSGLNWDKGIPMTCTHASHWEWTGQGQSKPFIFKILINDQLWSHGENFEAQPGEHKVIQPEF